MCRIMVTNLKKSLSPSSYVSSLRIPFFSGQCSSQIPQHSSHMAVQALLVLMVNRRLNTNQKKTNCPCNNVAKVRNQLHQTSLNNAIRWMRILRRICKTTPFCHSVHAKVVVDQQGVVHVMLLTFPVVAHVIHLYSVALIILL